MCIRDSTAGNKEYEFPWHISHFDTEELEDGEQIQGTYLEAHYTCLLYTSHLAMKARYVIEAVICEQRNQALFPLVEIGMPYILPEEFSFPLVEVKCCLLYTSRCV